MISMAVVLYHVKHVHSTEYAKFEKSGNNANDSTHTVTTEMLIRYLV
jgi:hypothetical protein